jgi:hypothetical protein
MRQGDLRTDHVAVLAALTRAPLGDRKYASASREEKLRAGLQK